MNCNSWNTSKSTEGVFYFLQTSSAWAWNFAETTESIFVIVSICLLPLKMTYYWGLFFFFQMTSSGLPKFIRKKIQIPVRRCIYSFPGLINKIIFQFHVIACQIFTKSFEKIIWKPLQRVHVVCGEYFFSGVGKVCE